MILTNKMEKIEIIDSAECELMLFKWFEEKNDTKTFIIPYTIEDHHKEFKKPNVVYKSIIVDYKIVGFIILNLEDDGKSLKFRKIVVNKKGKGYGKLAISTLDDIAKNDYQRSRIWLDVFAHNERAIHLYEKCGYKYQKSIEFQGKELKVYEKVV